jgi:hypothetical protein
MHVLVPINLMLTAFKTNRRLHNLTKTYPKQNATNTGRNIGSVERIFQWSIVHFSILRGIIRVPRSLALVFLISSPCPWSVDK